MSVQPLPIDSLRSIIKWELQQADKSLYEASHGKNRMARDDALGVLAKLIAERLKSYTITANVGGNEFSRLGVKL